MSRTLDRVLASARTGAAALAIAVGLALLKVPLIATFRAALVVLAALELLSFGHRALSASPGARAWVEIALKLAVLAAGYAAVGQ